MHGRANVNLGHGQIIIQQLGTTDTKQKFRLRSLNVATMRGCAGEVVETLTRRKVNVCCVQKLRWRGASSRLITGKNSEYKMYWKQLRSQWCQDTFFTCYLAAQLHTLSHYQGDNSLTQCQSLHFFHFSPEGDREPHNEVGSLSQAECIVRLKLGTF